MRRLRRVTTARSTTTCPYHQSVLHKVKPIFETFPGWRTEIGDARTLRRPPAGRARDFVRFVEEFAGVPFAFVTVGRARDQILVLQ